MIKEFSTEALCLKWLKEQNPKFLKWCSEIKGGRFVGIVFEVEVEND